MSFFKERYIDNSPIFKAFQEQIDDFQTQKNLLSIQSYFHENVKSENIGSLLRKNGDFFVYKSIVHKYFFAICVRWNEQEREEKTFQYLIKCQKFPEIIYYSLLDYKFTDIPDLISYYVSTQSKLGPNCNTLLKNPVKNRVYIHNLYRPGSNFENVQNRRVKFNRNSTVNSTRRQYLSEISHHLPKYNSESNLSYNYTDLGEYQSLESITSSNEINHKLERSISNERSQSFPDLKIQDNSFKIKFLLDHESLTNGPYELNLPLALTTSMLPYMTPPKFALYEATFTSVIDSILKEDIDHSIMSQGLVYESCQLILLNWCWKRAKVIESNSNFSLYEIIFAPNESKDDKFTYLKQQMNARSEIISYFVISTLNRIQHNPNNCLKIFHFWTSVAEGLNRIYRDYWSCYSVICGLLSPQTKSLKNLWMSVSRLYPDGFPNLENFQLLYDKVEEMMNPNLSITQFKKIFQFYENLSNIQTSIPNIQVMIRLGEIHREFPTMVKDIFERLKLEQVETKDLLWTHKMFEITKLKFKSTRGPMAICQSQTFLLTLLGPAKFKPKEFYFQWPYLRNKIDRVSTLLSKRHDIH